jgi:chondroitin 4-sulfotransferase 11
MSLLNDKFLFVHICKSGGGVITDNMSLNGKTTITGAHRGLEDMLKIAQEEHDLNPDDIYVFTIVRNPYERMLSLFFYAKQYMGEHRRNDFLANDPVIDSDFNKWIEYIYSDKFDRTLINSKVNVFTHCFGNQLNWLKDSDGNLMYVDRILRHEINEYEDMFKNVMDMKHYDCVTMVHPTKHEHYSKYYDDNSISLVTEHYQEDLDYFGYTFERK